MARGKLYLIDGSNNIYRCYYAIRDLTNSAGLATNAVYGFIQMLRKLLKDHKPDAVAVSFDVSGETFRHRQFEDYKRDRKPMPDDLSVQIPFIYEACEAFGLPIIVRQDYEADDLIGSLACKARDDGYEVVIATSDKDFFQMVGDGISLYHTGRDVIYDAQGVTDVFGLPPEKVVDVMGIWGDAIDNIPGVPGIGEKGAKSLIGEFGSLDNLFAHLDDVKKPSHRKALEAHREQAILSRELARIRCDLEIDIKPEDLKLGEPDRARLHSLFARLEFQSLMQEFLPPPLEVERHYRFAETTEELRLFLSGTEPIAIHLESATEGYGPPVVASLSKQTYESLIVPLSADLFKRPEVERTLLSGPVEPPVIPGPYEEFAAEIQRLLRSGRKLVAHDMKSNLRRLLAADWAQPENFTDTMIMSYVLQPGAYGHSLENLVRERLKRDLTTRKQLAKLSPLFGVNAFCCDFMGEKSDLTMQLLELLQPELERDKALLEIYERIERPLIPVLARMEQRGIRIDARLLDTMSKTMGQQLAELETKIYSEAGQEFNINSPSQLSVILFEKLQYPVLKKTQKTKSSSTGVDVLKELAGFGYKVPQLILEHRELHKLKSTYVDALPQIMERDGRVHTSFNQAVAATGRLSSSDPNLQNIPVRTQLGREIRRAFCAEPGNVLVAADYSQIELRILAHMTEDTDLIDAFKRGVDIHRATAAKIFNVAEPFVNSEQRRASKTINFGVLYGMSAFRLGNELAIPTGEAKEFIDAYFARYPRIREYLERTLVEARATGKVTTLFGRVRYIPEIHNRSWTVRGNAERMATNAPIQGTAADLLKIAMIAVEKELSRSIPRAGMLLTVHDEIVIEAPEVDADHVVDLVKSTMEGIYPLAVPLAVDTHFGKTWYEAKE